MQLYVSAAGGARTEMLCHHHDNFIAGHFSASHTILLVAGKYHGPGMVYGVKAYIQAY
jgi:hypothetical protein